MNINTHCAFTFVHKCSNTSNVKHKRNMLHNFEFWILIQIIMHTMPLVLNQSSLYEVMIFILCASNTQLRNMWWLGLIYGKKLKRSWIQVQLLTSFISVGIIIRNYYKLFIGAFIDIKHGIYIFTQRKIWFCITSEKPIYLLYVVTFLLTSKFC